MEFIEEDGRTTIRSFRERKSNFRKYSGACRAFPGGRDEPIAYYRDLRDPDDEVK